MKALVPYRWSFKLASGVRWDLLRQALMLPTEMFISVLLLEAQGRGHVHIQLVYLGIYCASTCGHSTLVLIAVLTVVCPLIKLIWLLQWLRITIYGAK